MPKQPKNAKKITLILASVFVACGVIAFFTFYWFHDLLKPVYTGDCSQYNNNSSESPSDSNNDTVRSKCSSISITISEGEPLSNLADDLAKEGIIKSSFAFQLYLRLSGNAEKIRAGEYSLTKTLSVKEITDILITGPKKEVFSLMLRPGETIMDLTKTLKAQGYSEAEISAALSKPYDFEILKSKPAGVSLEGYLYGDTYEFYKGESVENIIKRLLEEMQTVVTENNLEEAFQAQGLSLHEGLTLASIVQRESVPSKDDYAKVAQVFITRLKEGLKLGSDVTTQYALDLIDPDRTIYTDNASALTVDSPYNTRKYAGLPPGAISSPSLMAMQAVAHPADTSYLYFLTGDDGMMYYSYTESEHNQNAAAHCQELCNISL